MRPKHLTDEERIERQRERWRNKEKAKRIRKGDLSVGRGQVKKDEIVTTERVGQSTIHTKAPKEVWRPEPTVQLTADSKLEDLLPWALEVAESLRSCGNPAAWASSLNSVLKIIEFLDKKLPPVLPEAKPRPRRAILIDNDRGLENDL